MKRIVLPSLFILLFVSSCSTKVDYIANSPGRSARPGDCDIDVFLPNTSIEKDYDIIGSLFIGDGGLTVDCGQATVIRQAMTKGCQVGADAILISEIKEPDLISTCYRIKGNMLVYKSVPALPLASDPALKTQQVGSAKQIKPEKAIPRPPSTEKKGVAEEEPVGFEPIPFE